MQFRWIGWNLDHVESHGVDRTEVEQVVREARPPYPEARADDKHLVWGRGRGGRLLQVIFLYDNGDMIFVIHARPLAEREKKQYRRRTK